MLLDVGSNPTASTTTDTTFDTIVSRGVSLFNRKKRSDYKEFVVTALHFLCCVAKTGWFHTACVDSYHKALCLYIVKQLNFVKQPMAEKSPRTAVQSAIRGDYICTVISWPVLK